jgi:demethylmenaquinone methyltransferase / 2-methoxy-6-polyprenyl-1,4-benzoquinol methylase
MSTTVNGHREGGKATFVREMFARIAPRYDLANRVLTIGFDELWRRRAVALLHAPRGGRVIDLCCGTGDLVFGLLRADRTLDVTGVDFCEPMLTRARERARSAPCGKATFVQADVMALPFDEATFDGATMSFSMRNVVDVECVLREILRVLRSGSRFVNLDVSKAPNRVWKRAFDLYFYGVVPVVGGLVGGSRQAYAYLPSSLTHHPGAAELQDRFTRAGFARAGYRGLMGGAIAIHYGEKP